MSHQLGKTYRHMDSVLTRPECIKQQLQLHSETNNMLKSACALHICVSLEQSLNLYMLDVACRCYEGTVHASTCVCTCIGPNSSPLARESGCVGKSGIISAAPTVTINKRGPLTGPRRSTSSCIVSVVGCLLEFLLGRPLETTCMQQGTHHPTPQKLYW